MRMILTRTKSTPISRFPERFKGSVRRSSDPRDYSGGARRNASATESGSSNVKTHASSDITHNQLIKDSRSKCRLEIREFRRALPEKWPEAAAYPCNASLSKQ